MADEEGPFENYRKLDINDLKDKDGEWLGYFSDWAMSCTNQIYLGCSVLPMTEVTKEDEESSDLEDLDFDSPFYKFIKDSETLKFNAAVQALKSYIRKTEDKFDSVRAFTHALSSEDDLSRSLATLVEYWTVEPGYTTGEDIPKPDEALTILDLIWANRDWEKYGENEYVSEGLTLLVKGGSVKLFYTGRGSQLIEKTEKDDDLAFMIRNLRERYYKDVGSY